MLVVLVMAVLVEEGRCDNEISRPAKKYILSLIESIPIRSR